MTRATRVALVIGVLALAAVLVVLPLLRDKPPAGDGEDPQAVAAARARAALPPCPAPAEAEPPVKQLSGVRAMCLADGRRIDVGRLLAGRATLVNIWATWCEPCRTELPILARYAAGSGAVDVLTVQVDSGVADGLTMLADLRVRLPGVHDGAGRGPIRSALHTPGSLPASYLVDERGRVALIENPRVFESVEQVRSAVTRHRKETAA